MKLGGWQRLWIALSVAMMFPFGLIVLNYSPQIEDVWHEDEYYERLSETAKSQLAPPESDDVIAVEMPNNHVIRARSDVEPKSNVVFEEYNDIISSELRKQQLTLAGAVGAAWLVASLLLFAVGWVIGWIRRGFKDSSGTN